VCICMAHMRVSVLHPIVDAVTRHANIVAPANTGPSNHHHHQQHPSPPAAGGGGGAAASVELPSPLSASGGAASAAALSETWVAVLYGLPGVRASIANVEQRPAGHCPCDLAECYPSSFAWGGTQGVVTRAPHRERVLDAQRVEFAPHQPVE
jgi:hypothetical protein